MPLNQPNLCSAPRVLEVTRIIMRGVVPINSQLLVLISAPASDERSGASRRPNYHVPRCPGPRPATNQSNVSCHPLHLRRGGAYITSSAYSVRDPQHFYSYTLTAFKQSVLIFAFWGNFFILKIHFHWGLYEIITGQHKLAQITKIHPS